MCSMFYSSTFSLKFSLMLMSKKRDNKESMICLTPKPSQKTFLNNRSFYGLYQSQTLTPKITLYEAFEKTKQMQPHIQI